jgi:hypothetical protein
MNPGQVLDLLVVVLKIASGFLAAPEALLQGRPASMIISLRRSSTGSRFFVST